MKKKLFFLLLCFELVFLIFSGVRIFHTHSQLVLQSADPSTVKSIHLAKGTYRAWIDYTSNDANNAVTFISESAAPSFLADTLQLYPWRHSDYIQLWNGKNSADISLAFHSSGNLNITSIRVYQTDDSLRILWVLETALFLITDLVLLWIFRVFMRSSGKKGTVVRTLLIITAVFIACWPLHIHQLIAADDLTFHLERIEGICEALLSGQFPVRIFPTYFDGAGYAVSVFYGDILLYFPAFLRIMGFPLQTALKTYVIFVNLATAGVSWFVFSKILSDKWAAMLSTFVYTLSLYRLGDIFIRSAVGEYTAMIFIPLALGGFYLLFSQSGEQSGQDYAHSLRSCRNMIAIGMTGLLTSHCILSVLTAFFLFLWLLFYIKKLFRKEILKCLASSVALTVGLSAFFLIPFADYMLSGHYLINTKIADQKSLIQKCGITFKGLWNLTFQDTDMKTFGLIFCLLFVCFFIFLIVRFLPVKQKSCLHAGSRYDLAVLLVMSALSIWMSTVFFPWDLLSRHFSFFSVLANTMQFPFRFASIAVFLCALEAGICARLLDSGSFRLQLGKVFYIVLVTCVLAVTSFWSLQQFTMNAITVKIYDRAGLGLYIGYGTYQGYNIYDGAYLPVNTAIRQFQGMECTAVSKGSLDIGSFARKGMSLTVSCVNKTNSAQKLSVPLLYYKGYQAVSVSSHQKMPVLEGNNSVVTVQVPAGFHDSITVSFAEPWYWRAAELISLICLLLFYFFHKKLHILHS